MKEYVDNEVDKICLLYTSPGGDGSQVYLGIAVTDNINPAYQAQRDSKKIRKQ